MIPIATETIAYLPRNERHALENDRENHMHKLIAIAVAAAVGAVVAITATSGAHTPDAESAEILMPSILHMMSEAGTLPQTPIVGP